MSDINGACGQRSLSLVPRAKERENGHQTLGPPQPPLALVIFQGLGIWTFQESEVAGCWCFSFVCCSLLVYKIMHFIIAFYFPYSMSSHPRPSLHPCPLLFPLHCLSFAFMTYIGCCLFACFVCVCVFAWGACNRTQVEISFYLLARGFQGHFLVTSSFWLLRNLVSPVSWLLFFWCC